MSLGLGALDHRIGEDMGMALDHLVADGARHVLDAEGAGLPGHLGVEDDLEQEVAQLVLQGSHIAMLDGIRHLIGFLDGIGRNGREALLHVPGATARGIAQTGHDLEQPVDIALGHRIEFR